MTVGKTLTTLRKNRGLTQVQVQSKTGLSQTHLSQIECDRKQPSKTTVKRLAKLYKVPPIVIMWATVEEGHIDPKKKELFKQLKPVIDSLIEEILK